LTTTRTFGALRILIGFSVGLISVTLAVPTAAAPPVAASPTKTGKSALVAGSPDKRTLGAAPLGNPIRKPHPGAAPTVTAPLTPAQKAAITEGVRLNRKAGALQEQKRYAEALVIAKRSLELQESALGPGHPALSATEGFVADLLERTGRHDRALPLRERMLAARERSSGPESLDVARRLLELARDCAEVGNHARAIQGYERAGRIFAKSSPARLEVVESTLFVGREELAQGDLTAAEATLNKVLRMWEGQEHPYPNLVGDTHLALGQVYVAARREREATGAIERAVALHRQGIALNGLARAAMALGDLLLRRGAFAPARQAYAEAASSEHADLEHGAIAEFAVAGIDAQLGDYLRAESVLRQIIEAGPARTGAAFPRAQLGRGELFARLGNAASTEPLLLAARGAFEHLARGQGQDLADVAHVLQALAEVARLRGDARAAEALLVKARGIVEARRGPESPDVAAIEASLARLDEARGDLTSATRRARSSPSRPRSLRDGGAARPSGPRSPPAAALAGDAVEGGHRRGREIEAVALPCGEPQRARVGDHRCVVGAARERGDQHLDAATRALLRHAGAEAAVRGDAAGHDDAIDLLRPRGAERLLHEELDDRRLECGAEIPHLLGR
jgi:tetratricopeptide (TPR) repeat protein